MGLAALQIIPGAAKRESRKSALRVIDGGLPTMPSPLPKSRFKGQKRPEHPHIRLFGDLSQELHWGKRPCLTENSEGVSRSTNKHTSSNSNNQNPNDIESHPNTQKAEAGYQVASRSRGARRSRSGNPGRTEAEAEGFGMVPNTRPPNLRGALQHLRRIEAELGESHYTEVLPERMNDRQLRKYIGRIQKRIQRLERVKATRAAPKPRVNKLKPAQGAKGPHSTFKTDPKTGRVTGYTEYDAAGNPVKRFRGSGKPHGGQEPPLILEPKAGKGPGSPPKVPRAPRPDELPQGY